MADKIQKFLSQLSFTEKILILEIMERIQKGELSGLNFKKLVGHKDIFRVRKGKFRIIYRMNSGGIKFLTVDRRNDNTYNKF